MQANGYNYCRGYLLEFHYQKCDTLIYRYFLKIKPETFEKKVIDLVKYKDE